MQQSSLEYIASSQDEKQNGKYGSSPTLSIDENGLLNIRIKTEENPAKLDFCYYLTRDGFRMHSTGYAQGRNEFTTRISQKGTYSARIFVKKHGQHWSDAESYVLEPLTYAPRSYKLISIIIPTYNRESVIDKCLDSIYSQTMSETDFEIIVVDDCSTDNTSKILDAYSIQHSNLRQIKLPRNTGGASIPRNIGLDYAKGEYVFFLDSDYEVRLDSLLCDAYKLCKDQSLDICLIYGYRNVPQTSPRPIGKYRLRQPIMDCLNIMKRDSLNKVNPRFYDFMGNEDIVFTLQYIFNSDSIRANWIPGQLIVELRELRNGSPRSNEKWREMIEAFVDVSFYQLSLNPSLADGIYYAYAALWASLPHVEMKYRVADGIPLGKPVTSMSYVSQTVIEYLASYLNYRVPAETEECLEPEPKRIFALLRKGNRDEIINAANQSL